jgi:hypothetical protein
LSGKPIEIVVSLASLADVLFHISTGFMEPEVSQDPLVTVETSVHGLNGQFSPLLDDLFTFAHLAVTRISTLATFEA